VSLLAGCINPETAREQLYEEIIRVPKMLGVIDMTAQQTEKEKWQELAQAIGWNLLLNDSTMETARISSTDMKQSYVIRKEFRDAIAAVKQRTPLERAAEEMGEVLQLIVKFSNCNALNGVHVEDIELPCMHCRIKKILKKAGVIE